MSSKIPIILTGPAGCGKSHYIHTYVHENRLELHKWQCRRDKTLRDGREKLHVWAKRMDPAVIWLEGADDLTPEAQAFLRRVLETHASGIQFILECRDSAKLQEPIRSRCTIRRLFRPSWEELSQYILRKYPDTNTSTIKTYLDPDEYSYRRILQCSYLQRQFPEIWTKMYSQRQEERAVVPHYSNIPSYLEKGYNPEIFVKPLLENPNILKDYAECLNNSGSTWAFLGSALYTSESVPRNGGE